MTQPCLLLPDDVACIGAESCKAACESEVGCSNVAYPKLVLELLPTGRPSTRSRILLVKIFDLVVGCYNVCMLLLTHATNFYQSVL